MQTISDPDTRFQAGPGTRLALWDTDDPTLQATAAILADWFGLTLLEALPDPGTDANRGALLLLCRAPSEFICRALEQDRLPEAALEDWQARIRPVLALNRANRGKVHLIDADALHRDPVAYLKHFGLAGKEGAIAALSAQAEAQPDPILQMLARQSLQADLASRVLASETDAVMIRLQTGTEGGNEAGMLAQAYHQRHDEQRELDLLRSQQQGMYEQMETLYGEKMQAEQRLEQLNSGLESYQAQVEALTGETRDLRTQLATREEDIKALRGRIATKEQVLQAAGRQLRDAERENAALAQAKDALEQAGDALAQTLTQANDTLRDEVGGLEQVRDDQAARIGALEAENHRILNSRSYRLMAPLRSLRSALRGGGR